jgi:hypothetical protein
MFVPSVVLFLLLVMVYVREYRGLVYHDRVYVDSSHSALVKTLVAAELREIEKLARTFVADLRRAYPNDRNVQRLRNWSGNLRELPMNGEHILASNVNKGEVISVCMLNKQGRLNARNDIVWVLLHELAHVMTSAYRHDDEFWKHNKFLVEEAVQRKVYTFTRYEDHPKNFCGSVLRYNF